MDLDGGSSDIPCGHTVIQVDDQGQNCIWFRRHQYVPDRGLHRPGAGPVHPRRSFCCSRMETNLVPYIIGEAAGGDSLRHERRPYG